MFWLTLAGLLLVQAAWILVVPPFRNIDEHEHVFKAAAVARGDWSARHEPAPHGWGELVVVPGDLVAAAHAECETLSGTTVDSCNPVRDLDDGLVEVASAAARYHPAYYAVVGTVAKPFSGHTALYVMRGASAVMCALLLAATAAVVARWSMTRWPLTAFLLTVTPVLLYSTTVVAPNGLEMATAGLLWAALLGLCRSDDALSRDRLMTLATVAAVPLVTLRSLGPLWCLLIVVCVLPLAGRARLAELARRPRTWVAFGVVAAATGAAGAWVLAAGTNEAGNVGGDFDEPMGRMLSQQWLLWFFQSVGAFPYRDEMAPLALLAIYLAAMAVVAVLGVIAGSARDRVALAAVFLLGSLVPLANTALLYEQLGTFWQGRYTLPLTMGFLLVCGTALDRRPQRIQVPALAGAAVVAVVWAGSMLIGQVSVLHKQLRESPLAGTDAWVTAPAWAVAVLTLLGAGVLAAVVVGRRQVPASTVVPAGDSVPQR